MHKNNSHTTQSKSFLFWFPFLLFGLIFFCPATKLFAQTPTEASFLNNLHVQHIGVEHGLSQGSIYSIYKDSRNFMWFSSNEGLNRYDGFEIKVYQNNSSDNNSLAGNYINGIVEDPYGNLWIGSEVCLNRYIRAYDHFDFVFAKDQKGEKNNSTNYPFYADSSNVWYTNSKEGVLIYNFKTDKKRIISDSFFYSRTNYTINSTFRTQDGNVWIRQNLGLARIQPESGKVSYYFSGHPDNVLGDPMEINCFYQSKDGTIYMSSGHKMLTLDAEGLQHTTKELLENVNSTITDIRQDREKNLWFGTEQDGLFLFDKHGTKIMNFTSSGIEALQLTNNSAGTIYIDNQDIIWTNVDPEGINMIKKDFKAFKAYKTDLFSNDQFVSCGIRHFAERPDGKIWIVTQKDGTCLFNPKTEQIEKFLRPDDIDLQDRNEGYVFIDSRERVWVGTYSGFFYFEDNGEEYFRIFNKANLKKKSLSNFIWNMLEAPDGNLIFSTEAGVFFMDPNDLKPKALFGLNKSTAQLHLNDRSQLLISEYHKGFHVIDYKTAIKETASINKNNRRHFLPEYNIKCFYQEKGQQDYWIGTNNGLLHIYPNEQWTEIDSLVRYTQEHGLPSIYIYGILPDEEGQLWISTNRGLAAFDLATEKIKKYVLEDGVQGYEFNTNSYLKASTGEMYFGGTNGFNRFFPKQIKKNPYPPLSIQFTDFKTNKNNNKISTYIGEQTIVDLPYDQNTFTISYASLDYLSNGHNQYKIFLEGYDTDWQYVGTQRTVRYTGVPEGHYTFYVNASNRDGVWAKKPTQLVIQIAAPWYRTWWAYLLYLCSAGIILYNIYIHQTRRKLLQLQLQSEQKEAERLKEIDSFKNKIYTNITHEFRTPLTIIKGMSDNINDRTTRDLIQRNSNNLLALVNQMLDLSKLESGSMPLRMREGNILAFLKYLVESFHSLASAKNIVLTFQSELETFQMAFDQNKLSKIIANLLVNSIKFTSEKGKIEMHVSINQESNNLIVKITDNGKGIPKDQLDLIFDRFYQIENTDNSTGTGIGLALVKELIKLQEGKIKVESTEGVGTVFTLQFPITHCQLTNDVKVTTTHLQPLPLSLQEEQTKTKQNSERPLLLIIEDNPDIVQYMKTILHPSYELLIASDGKAGLDQAFEKIPDIIISDVMMPRMDGFEVCATLKQDEKTSHIPIILLTAKAASEDKIMGLSFGADAYLIKPFERAELLIRLEQLLILRKKLQSRYNQLSDTKENKDEKSPTTIEDEFLQKVQNMLLAHLSEEDYSIDKLANDLHLSRSQLYRKIKALTNLSTSIYIRSIRLHKAKQLLLAKKHTISEVAYLVGFNSPVYFSQVYKETFGHSPNQEIKKNT